MADQKIVARVAGHEITEAEFNDYLARLPQQQQQYAATDQGRELLLTQYTNIYLFAKLGRERKYDQAEEYKEALKKVETEFLSQYALMQVIKGAGVTKEEAKEYYDKNPELFKTEGSAHAYHILTNTEEEALKAKKEIESGQKSFEDAAKEYSTDGPSSARGGDLGTFPKGQMVKEFEEAVFGVKENELGKVIGPVKTQFGYHLIRVDKLEGAGTLAFEDVAPSIAQQIVGGKQDKIYQETREKLVKQYGLEFVK
ncbi:MAG: peptidylprolyl isomerase [Lachnospiraceae bacterium]|nr:peptidylprolyl isomerase [Lachnospiraceae bacterium]